MTSCALLLKPKSQYSLVSKLLPTLTNYSYCMQKGQRVTVRIQSCGVQVAWRQWGAVWSWCQWTQEDGSSHVLLVCTQDSWNSLSAWRGQGGRRLEKEEKVDDHPIIYCMDWPNQKEKSEHQIQAHAEHISLIPRPSPSTVMQKFLLYQTSYGVELPSVVVLMLAGRPGASRCWVASCFSHASLT